MKGIHFAAIFTLILACNGAGALDLRLFHKTSFTGIALEGVLDEPDIGRLKGLIKREGFAKPYILFIDMRGGAQIAAQAMSALMLAVAKAQRRQGVPLQVAVVGRCYSACTLLMTKLTKGSASKDLRIWVSPEARFGLHGPRLRKNGVWLNTDGENSHLYTHFRNLAIRDYLESGLNSDWVQYLHQPELKIFGPREICERESRIVPKQACMNSKREMSQTMVQHIHEAAAGT
ncbi:MAG: hypothetical protein AB7G93_23105 [Bdellovibrionales bacterium]